MASLPDDPPTDLLEDRGNVRIDGWLALEKARLEARRGAIEIDALKNNTMQMDMQIEGAPEALDKRHRSRLYLLLLDPAFDCMVDVIL